MTGPENYQAAERLAADGIAIESALHATQDDEHRAALDRQAVRVLARAQVHATLALAAASALCATGMLSTCDYEEWYDAAGTPATRPGSEQ